MALLVHVSWFPYALSAIREEGYQPSRSRKATSTPRIAPSHHYGTCYLFIVYSVDTLGWGRLVLESGHHQIMARLHVGYIYQVEFVGAAGHDM